MCIYVCVLCVNSFADLTTSTQQAQLLCIFDKDLDFAV